MGDPEKRSAPLVALTGGIGSGKSTALAFFARRGAAVLDCDAVVHELLEREDVSSRIAAGLGIEPLPAGAGGRRVLAQRVFDDATALKRLEEILYPLVREAICAWRESAAVAAAPLAVVEIQMLFEAEMDDLFDALVLLAAGADIRRERVAGRMPGDDFDRRAGRQLTDTEKAPRCDFSFENSTGLDALEAFVDEVYVALTGQPAA